MFLEITSGSEKTMKILFVDRDGVLNKDFGYTHIFDKNLIYEDVRCLSRFKIDRIIVITNQSGIGRGYYTLSQFKDFMQSLKHFCQTELNFVIDDYFYCPHDPTVTSCSCRKPRPGLLLQALKKYRTDPRDCLFVGDKLSDIEAGLSAGLHKNILLTRDDSDSDNVHLEQGQLMGRPGVGVIKSLSELSNWFDQCS